MSVPEFRAAITEELSDGTPKKLTELYCGKFKAMSYGTFSSQISNMVRDKCLVKKEVKNVPNSERYFYHI